MELSNISFHLFSSVFHCSKPKITWSAGNVVLIRFQIYPTFNQTANFTVDVDSSKHKILLLQTIPITFQSLVDRALQIRAKTAVLAQMPKTSVSVALAPKIILEPFVTLQFFLYRLINYATSVFRSMKAKLPYHSKAPQTVASE